MRVDVEAVIMNDCKDKGVGLIYLLLDPLTLEDVARLLKLFLL